MTQRSSMLTLIICFSGIPAAADPCEYTFTCDPADGSGAYYARTGAIGPSGTYQPTTPSAVSPDRRPGFFMQTYGGHTISTCSGTAPNPLGHAHFWRFGTWDNVSTAFFQQGAKQFLEKMTDEGFNRLIIERPGGNAQNQELPLAGYDYLSGLQKDLLDDISSWVASYKSNNPTANFELGVHIGSWQSGSSCTPCLNPSAGGSYWDCSDDDDDLGFTYPSSPQFFDPYDQASMQETFQNFYPWIDLGFDTIWIDNSSRWDVDGDGTTEFPPSTDDSYIGPMRLLDLIQSPDYASIRIAGEAFPQDLDPTSMTQWDIDSNYSDLAPYFMLYAAFESFNWHSGGTNPQSVDPSTTELNVVFQGTSYTLAQMVDVRDAGFVVWISNHELAPLVQRIYDGPGNELYAAFISNGGNMADFDADGDVDCDDKDLFATNWTANYNGSGSDSIWDGDVDGDGNIDLDDVTFFVNLSEIAALSCP